MKKSLPAGPNLEPLGTQAKQLLTELRAGKTAAIRTFIDHLPAARTMTPAKVRGAGFRLADAQSVVARTSGFAAWPSLARHVEQLRALEGDWRFRALGIDGGAGAAAKEGPPGLLLDRAPLFLGVAASGLQRGFTVGR